MALILPGELLRLIADYYVCDDTDLVLLSQVSKNFYSMVMTRWKPIRVRITASGKHASSEEMIRWLASNKCEWGDTFSDLVFLNKLPLLKILVDVGCRPSSLVFDTVAAPRGYLEIIQWAHKNRYLIRSFRLTANAAINDHLELLQWLIREDYPVYNDICSHAVRHEHVLEWLLNNGYPCSSKTLESIAQWGSVNSMKLARKFTTDSLTSTMTIWASCNSLEMLEYLLDEGVVPSGHTYYSPCRTGNMDMVLFLHGRHCPLPENVMIYGAMSGSIELLEFLKSQARMLYTSGPIYQAACNNRYEAVVWLIENGCTWKMEAYDRTTDPAIKEYLLNCGVTPEEVSEEEDD